MEVKRSLDACCKLLHKTLISTLYESGVRADELIEEPVLYSREKLSANIKMKITIKILWTTYQNGKFIFGKNY